MFKSVSRKIIFLSIPQLFTLKEILSPFNNFMGASRFCKELRIKFLYLSIFFISINLFKKSIKLLLSRRDFSKLIQVSHTGCIRIDLTHKFIK
jgi:hypothetical protein